jgi:hypothetical protein
MNLDFNFSIKDLEGKEIKENGTVVLVNKLFAGALINPACKKGDVLKKWELAQKIFKEGVLEVDAADFNLLKDIAKEPELFAPIVQAQLILYFNSIK